MSLKDLEEKFKDLKLENIDEMNERKSDEELDSGEIFAGKVRIYKEIFNNLSTIEDKDKAEKRLEGMKEAMKESLKILESVD